MGGSQQVLKKDRGPTPAQDVVLSEPRTDQEQHLQRGAETPGTPHFSLLRRPILELPRQ